jgi:1,4-alpha-glucan branching enzyme
MVKKSLAGKMPGDEWQNCKFVAFLYSYMFAHPGTKLLFMEVSLVNKRVDFQKSLIGIY